MNPAPSFIFKGLRILRSGVLNNKNYYVKNKREGAG